MIQGIRDVVNLPEPIGKTLLARAVAGEAGGLQFGEHLFYLLCRYALPEHGRLARFRREHGRIARNIVHLRNNLFLYQNFQSLQHILRAVAVPLNAGENLHARHLVQCLPQLAVGC